MIMNKEIVKEWKYKDKQCVILYFHNHYCAYVETKLKGVSYSQEFGTYETSPESNIEAHGGLTFSGELKEVDSFKGVWFFGMDFAHAGDYIEDMPHFSDNEQKWTLEQVEEETIKMANSIINYEKIYYKYSEIFEKFKKEIQEVKEND